jgi:hypothetical protein
MRLVLPCAASALPERIEWVGGLDGHIGREVPAMGD